MKPPPKTQPRRRRRITWLLYPFGWGAMAVNVFFASLLGSWLGLPVLSPLAACALGALLAVPATWLFAGHIERLILSCEKPAPTE